MLEIKCEPSDEVPSQEELGILSVNSLRRSVSQMMDGKSLTGDDEVWDPNISGHDSGMVRDPVLYTNMTAYKLLECRYCLHLTSSGSLLQFMDDEEFVDTIKGFSTIKKEHTMFTDTNLWPDSTSDILNMEATCPCSTATMKEEKLSVTGHDRTTETVMAAGGKVKMLSSCH